ncbi:MAG TPA: amidohydrolase [Candidatus Faeciplasma pullistercoris]|uniref:Amidohydrolase n=1 Tax=Candidatus Faeciplasma pullistercoris TaxID=2840800 RepID=A0A9D1KL49_9FIRM|nr:amidohydrolase [Candidatus Faeciplasma pullistercoris]
MIIDAHVHLWEKQNGMVNSLPVYDIGSGKSMFLGEIRQMMPAYMDDGRNTAERLIANMDYACVNACVCTQEYMDGNQDEYLLSVKKKYPNRFKICSLYEEKDGWRTEGFDGIKICASRLADRDLKKLLPVFKDAEQKGMFISIDMADGAEQTQDLQYLADNCPDLRIAIGHFGMVTTDGWQSQIALAKNKNVYIESGGLTWLFNYEYYPFPSAIEAVREAISICGADKLMWGSDYPRTMTEITYKMAVRFIRETTRLTDEEKKAFLGENARRFYGFEYEDELSPIANML